MKGHFCSKTKSWPGTAVVRKTRTRAQTEDDIQGKDKMPLVQPS